MDRYRGVVCTQCWGIVPDEGVHMVEGDGELCSCAIDVWLRIPDDDDDGEPEAEANTFYALNAFRVRVDWYLTAVGLVTSRTFNGYEEARAWLTAEGFQDFSS